MTILQAMRTLGAIAAGILLSTVALAAPADAGPYSLNRHVGAHLIDVVKCQGDLTVYEIDLRNHSRQSRRFRAFEVQRGVKLGDSLTRVARGTSTGLLFYVPAGERRAVTVTHQGEVIVHRHLTGICY